MLARQRQRIYRYMVRWFRVGLRECSLQMGALCRHRDLWASLKSLIIQKAVPFRFVVVQVIAIEAINEAMMLPNSRAIYRELSNLRLARETKSSALSFLWMTSVFSWHLESTELPVSLKFTVTGQTLSSDLSQTFNSNTAVTCRKN